MPILRTITYGQDLNAADLEQSAAQVKDFFAHAQRLLDEPGIAARCFRYVAPPLEVWLPDATPEKLAELAPRLEAALGDNIWCCLPGPQCLDASSNPQAVEMVDAILANTQQTFSNISVAGAQGLHNESVNAAASMMVRLAHGGARQQDNFRFAALGWVKPGTPYFPAAWHEGEPGFSVALELAGPFNAACAAHNSFATRLAACKAVLVERVSMLQPLLERLAQERGVRFLGFDLSLAPFPSEETSAVTAVESLNGSLIGHLDFLFAIYAMNDMLQNAIPGLPLVGFNGTMLSVLEDSRLAQATATGEVSIKDLLLYSTVCGCGLDMVPVPANTDAEHLATLVRAIATISHKWRKPLIARLLPSSTDEHGSTLYEHAFLINTTVLPLESRAQVPSECFGLFEPMRKN